MSDVHIHTYCLPLTKPDACHSVPCLSLKVYTTLEENRFEPLPVLYTGIAGFQTQMLRGVGEL